jgi:SsrA-binding protein
MAFQKNINIKNKKVYHNYALLDKYIAGIVLSGTEIKSIRQGKATLVDSYCFFKNGELFIQGFHVTEYEYGTHNNHAPKRYKKLLLNKKELRKLERKNQEKGLTIVATRCFINDRGFAKMEIALAKGKQEHDKRETIKRKDLKREMDRIRKF